MPASSWYCSCQIHECSVQHLIMYVCSLCHCRACTIADPLVTVLCLAMQDHVGPLDAGRCLYRLTAVMSLRPSALRALCLYKCCQRWRGVISQLHRSVRHNEHPRLA